MNTLKKLNLINVLNNLNNKELHEVLSKTDARRILNIITNVQCRYCENFLCYHTKCYFCGEVKCTTFFNNTNDNSCIKCLSNEIFTLNCDDFYGVHITTNIGFSFGFYNPKNNKAIKNKKLNYKEVLEFLKSNDYYTH